MTWVKQLQVCCKSHSKDHFWKHPATIWHFEQPDISSQAHSLSPKMKLTSVLLMSCISMKRCANYSGCSTKDFASIAFNSILKLSLYVCAQSKAVLLKLHPVLVQYLGNAKYVQMLQIDFLLDQNGKNSCWEYLVERLCLQQRYSFLTFGSLHNVKPIIWFIVHHEVIQVLHIQYYSYRATKEDKIAFSSDQRWLLLRFLFRCKKYKGLQYSVESILVHWPRSYWRNTRCQIWVTRLVPPSISQTKSNRPGDKTVISALWTFWRKKKWV